MSVPILDKVKVLNWYDETRDCLPALFALELERDSNDNEFYLTDDYIAKFGLPVGEELFELTERCLITQLFVSGYLSLDEKSATGHNWGLKLLGWYEKLSDGDKKEIPIYGNKIGVRGLADYEPQFSKLSKLIDYPGVKTALEIINHGHKESGYFDDDYVPVKERKSKATGNGRRPEDSLTIEFKRLRESRVDKPSEFEVSAGSKLFLCVMHLFAYTSSFNAGKDTWRAAVSAYTYFVRFLIGSGFTGVESLFVLIGQYSLIKFRTWLEELVIEGEISPYYANTLLSKTRLAFKSLRAISEQDGFNFYEVEGFDTRRVTDLYRPYSPGERERIAGTVNKDISLFDSLVEPYVKTGIGVDPFVEDQSKLRVGFGTLDNMRWVFENRLNCTPPTPADRETCRYARTFTHTLLKLRVSALDVYHSWGVLTNVDSTIITPYIVRLAQVTGLNADSLKGLDVDDYDPCHRLTRRPCLKYWKERSGGEKLQHLDLAHAEITWLTTAQSVEVAKIFSSVIALTKSFRHEAPNEISNKLFIWKTTNGRANATICSLASGGTNIVIRLFSAYSKAKGLTTDDGKPLSLSASRLRPSFVSELLDRGVTAKEIQVILGHSHLRTTLAYLDRMDFNRMARTRLNEAITSIHSSAVEAEPKLIKVVAVDEAPAKSVLNNPYGVVFKTPLADCMNIMNPPDFVKKLSSYVPGSPCSLYNKCLSCENAMITVAHLPHLFALYRDYSRLVEVSRVMDTPYGGVVRENMGILKTILNPETSDFSADELSEAKRLSDYISSTVLVDGVGL
ncbi:MULTISPECIES: hypothetical protein [Pseudomonas]|uniref:hypothetical protein n=1 Tax=Pseudomonas TaxID=286 RepID=UPI001E57FEC0|nr:MULTISPECIES: hypothetical protein [Pseudomonas]WQQ36821.1 hypothetical protein SO572_25000 [Pseudomonas putida]